MNTIIKYPNINVDKIIYNLYFTNRKYKYKIYFDDELKN